MMPLTGPGRGRGGGSSSSSSEFCPFTSDPLRFSILHVQPICDLVILLFASDAGTIA